MSDESKIVWTSNEQLRNGKPFLTVKKRPEGYYFVERLGVDSVAFVLYDKNNTTPFGLTKEFKNPLNEFLVTAFGGSLDKQVSLEEIVKDEVREEAGYIVESNRISSVGKRFVSTQMNQFCHLYLVDVTGLTQGKTDPQNETEALAQVVWLSKEDVINGIDWKAQVIVQNLEALTRKGILSGTNELGQDMLKVEAKLGDAYSELVVIKDKLLRLAQAKIYFEKNTDYLRNLYNNKTDQQIIFIIAASDK